MDQREARKFVTANPPPDPLQERRPSLLGRLLFRRTSSTDDANIAGGLDRRSSMDQPEVGNITQRVQQEMNVKKAGTDPTEFSLFT